MTDDEMEKLVVKLGVKIISGILQPAIEKLDIDFNEQAQLSTNVLASLVVTHVRTLAKVCGNEEYWLEYFFAAMSCNFPQMRKYSDNATH